MRAFWRSFYFFYGIALILISFDWITKQIADSSILYGVPNVVFSWLNMTLIYNKGAAFGFLSDEGGWQFFFLLVVSIVVSIYLIYWILFEKQIMLRLGATFLLGGTGGNLIDRIQNGHVIDFISLHYKATYYFAVFNFADIFINIGIGLLLIYVLIDTFGVKKEGKTK